MQWLEQTHKGPGRTEVTPRVAGSLVRVTGLQHSSLPHAFQSEAFDASIAFM